MNFEFSIEDLKRIITPAFYVGLAFAIGGSVFFLFQWDFSEGGHAVLFFIYITGCLVLIPALRFARPLLSGIIIVILLAILAYSFAKFDWRRDYIEQTNLGNFPAIDRHINRYPTFEEHHLAPFIGSPRWIDFSRECFQPALENRPMAENCHSAKLILDYYNIDINDVIQTHYNKMRKTAQMLQNGQFTNENVYRTCLETKNCAFIPLLPPDANIDTITPRSEEYIEVRRQFWSIIKNNSIRPEVCNFVDLCRVMRDANVITLRN
jgi:hypothetical protein